MESEVLLEAKDVHKDYPIKRKSIFRHRDVVKAVRGVTFSLLKKETFGCVGESGCGKSTLSRLLIMLEHPTRGEILYRGENIHKTSRHKRFKIREKVQLVLQDPYLSLPPRMKVEEIVADPLRIHNNQISKAEMRERVLKILREVGLNENDHYRFPLSFSAGQRQLINVARAIILNPEIVILDEAVSALDVSVQASILNLFAELREKHDLTYLLIAHDIGVVKHMCDRIAVMYLGKFVEMGSNQDIFDKTLHPYTSALLNAVPTIETGLKKEPIELLTGEVPGPINIPLGCTFEVRCPKAMNFCKQVEPEMIEVENGHYVSCHLYK